MSLKSRLKGAVAGMAVGAMAPIFVPMGIKFIATGESGGSGAGPALAAGFAAVSVVLGGVAILGGATIGTMLSFGGLPWFVTVPGCYFLVWALLGAFFFGGEGEKATKTQTSTI